MAYFRPTTATESGVKYYYTVTSESPKTCTLNRIVVPTAGTSVKIPNALQGYTITKIRDGTSTTDCLTYNKTANPDVSYNQEVDTTTRTNIVGLDLTSLTACTNIGNSSFSYCTNLVGTITIPSCIKTVGNFAFHSTKITTLVIQEGVVNLNNDAFNNCGFLTSVTIPTTVTKIGNWAFSRTYALTTFNFSGNSTYVLYNDIIYTADYKTVVSCPGGKTGTWSTNGVINTNIIHQNVTSFQNGAFWGAKKITGEIIVPTGVTSIAESAFRKCAGATGIKIPSTVKTIYANAFSGCTGVNTRVVIPESVTRIDAYGLCKLTNAPEVLFMHSSISSLTMNNNYQFTSGNADVHYMFRDTQANVTAWGNFTTTHFTNTNWYFAVKITFDSNGGEKTLEPIYEYNTFTTPSDVGENVMLESWNTNAIATGTSYELNTSYAVPSQDTTLYAIWTHGITTMDNAIYKFHITDRVNKTCMLDSVLMTERGNLVVPNTLIGYTITTMRDGGYTNGESGGVFTPSNDYMQTVDLSNLTSLQNIGDYAFKDAKVSSLVIPDSVTTLGYGAFLGMSNITSMDISANVTSMVGAFGDNASLTAINIDPANTTYVSVDGVVYISEMTSIVAYPSA